MSYKNLKLSIADCETVLNTVADEMSGTVTLKDNGKGLIQASIEIPGKGTALINIYDTPKGLTLNPSVGKLKEISEMIAQKIASSCETVKTKEHIFQSIGEQLYKDFIEHANDEFKVTPHTDDDVKIIVKVTNGKTELTITWYKTSHKLMIQGKTTPLWDDTVLWFAGHICDNPEEIINIVFDTYEMFDKTRIKYDDAFLERLLHEKIEDVYGNSKILKDYEVKWLKTSLFLIETNIDLPEYYPSICSAIKVIEGILRRVCMNKFGPTSFNGRNFHQFEESPAEGGIIKLKDVYKSILTDNAPINYVEKLYIFMKTKRNRYTHNPGAAAAEVASKESARDIFDEVIELIRESNSFKKELF